MFHNTTVNSLGRPTIVKVYTQYTRASKYIKQKLNEQKGEIDKSIMIVFMYLLHIYSTMQNET